MVKVQLKKLTLDFPLPDADNPRWRSPPPAATQSPQCSSSLRLWNLL